MLEKIAIQPHGLRRLETVDPLVFFHIPKTAGTTLSTILKARLGDAMFEAKSQAILDRMGDGGSGLAMVSGHFVKERIYPAFPRENLLTLLRDPVERVVSQYLNWRDPARIEWDAEAWDIDAASRDAIETAQSCDLETFLNTANRVIMENTQNIYVRAFCDQQDVDPASDDPGLVDSAFENLRRFFWFGLVDRMEESMLMLARQLGFAELVDGALQVHNASKKRMRVSGRERALARRINALDYRLMDMARGEFGDRLRSLLRDGVKLAMRRNPDVHLPRLAIEFSDLRFLSGWSFAEQTDDARSYRWSYAGVEADVLLPAGLIPMARDFILDIDLLAIADGLDPATIAVALDYGSPTHIELQREGNGWRLFCRFAGRPQAHQRPCLSIRAGIASATSSSSGDPRNNLGVALGGLELSISETSSG
jgi:hypothetical protein